MMRFPKIYFFGFWFFIMLSFHVAASTYYVDVNSLTPTPPYTNWATASTDIQSAIDAATDGDLVLVNDGIYQTGGEALNGYSLTNRVIINKNITVQSVNGPTNTFIEGPSVPTFFTRNFVHFGNNSIRCVCMTTNSTLSGFTLMNGCTLSSGSVNDESGGGIWCASTNNYTISNCVITANASWYQGGGAYQGTLLNCAIMNNICYGGYGGGASSSIIFGSLVVSNGAVYPKYGTTEGGGVYNSSVFNSAIAENSAASEGGGAYGGTLVNCTITGNTAYIQGGGTDNSVQTNCIIYYNQVFTSASSYTNCYTGTLNYCCTTPNPGGAGNITAVPLLADFSHISLNSPCRGAGNPVASTGTDIDGNPWSNPPSIGCSEIPPGGDYGNLVVNISTPFTNQAPGYPLAFQTAISGPDYMSVWNFGNGTNVTNIPNLSHTWSAPGTYAVTLTAYNDSYPNGITATQMVTIAVPSVYYVNIANPNPTTPYAHWSTAATNIQDAVSLAPAGSLILVTNTIATTNALPLEGLASNGIAVYQYGGGIAPNGWHYRVILTNAVTLQSVNGPSKTYIEVNPSIETSGCVYMTNGAVLIGFTLTNGFAPRGTGVFATSTNAVITNCIISACSAGTGGGVYSGTLYNCALIGNSTSGGNGGASFASILNNCVLIKNNAGFGGGAYGGTLNNCLIASNTATDGGGAFGGVLNNCVIVSNTATDGGGAYGNAGEPIVLNNCNISNNTAQFGGGVDNFSAFYTNCILTNCLITLNSAITTGGGAFQAYLNNCIISSNKASGPPFGGGGVEGGLLNNCTLIGNSGLNGGGADGYYVKSQVTALNNCTLIGNVASAVGGGANDCTLNQCTILQNSSPNGGGGAATSILNNCLIISNSASGNAGTTYGGGIYSCASTDCILAYNFATNGAGASESTLVNCTLVYNSAQFGGGIAGCTADNCILYYNTGGDYGNDVYHSYLGNTINYCCIEVLTNGIGNITNAPLFVNPSDGDFHLQFNSPCINSGENAYTTSTTDLDGNPRIVGGTVDIGAYEYQTPASVISYAYLQQYNLPTDGSVDSADLDGTGFNVYQDWIASLNPTNSASVLAMLPPVATNASSGVTVSWQSVGGIPYQLQRSTNLSAQPFATLQNITGLAGTTSYTDTTATNNVPYFYRVGVAR